MITPIYFAIFAIGLFALFLNVVRFRIKHKVSLGDGDNADIKCARAAHGNYVETVPFILIAMILLEMQGYGAAVIHFFGAAMIVSRTLHFVGLRGENNVGKGRFFGSLLFNILLIAAAKLLLYKALFG